MEAPPGAQSSKAPKITQNETGGTVSVAFN